MKDEMETEMCGDNQMTSSLAIFIDSYDGNSDIWESFFNIQNTYWNDCMFKKYIVSNNQTPEDPNVVTLKTGDNRNWFDMTIKGLKCINEEYILFLLEDYFISKEIANDELLKIIEQMRDTNVFYYRLTSPVQLSSNESFILVPDNTPYPISLQPAIWNRQVFFSFLNELKEKGCKTPWEFEKYFIEKYKNCTGEKNIVGIRYDSRDILGYKNAVIQGKWDPRIIKYYRKRNIAINIGSRGIMPFKLVAMDAIKRNRLLRSLSYSKQRKIKRLLKKLGIDFMT